MITVKSEKELKIMAEGGEITARVIEEVLEKVEPGVSTWELDRFAEKRIRELGGEPGFKKVSGYDFATCININAGLVHGIPSKDKILREGDIVSVDLGVFYKGFHTDAAWTKAVPRQGLGIGAVEIEKFLDAGKKALERAIGQCREGNYVGDISAAVQETIEGAGFNVIQALVGHGVGRELHEEPQIPCFGEPKTGARLKREMTLAVEILYAMGQPEIEVLGDGWTIVTRDGSLAVIFEETVAVGKKGPRVLTSMGLKW